MCARDDLEQKITEEGGAEINGGSVGRDYAAARGGTAYAILSCKANAPCRGTDKLNQMLGSPGSNVMQSFGGSGSMSGGGPDKMYGGPRSEGGDANGYMSGGFGANTMRGGDGNDSVFGDEDGDTLHGGNGQDTIGGDAGPDKICGNTGNDSIDTGWQDGERDYVDCGAGNDSVGTNAEDRTVNCEDRY